MAYVPPEITQKKDGGKQPVAVADNFDHNEHTVNGLGTTHAMTSILVSPFKKENTELYESQENLLAH